MTAERITNRGVLPSFRPSPEVKKPLAMPEKPSLADLLQASVASVGSTPSLLRTSETAAGNSTFSLTTYGREMGKELYRKLNLNVAQLPAEIHAIRQGINKDLGAIRKEQRAELTSEWEILGMKKRGNMAAFNRELQERLVNDPQIQRYQLERRLLFSITQQARAALTAETRRTIRASITEGQRQAFFQAAAAKGQKVPRSIALQDTLITAWLMRHQEQPSQQEERERQTKRAECLTARVGLRVKANQQRLQIQAVETIKAL